MSAGVVPAQMKLELHPTVGDVKITGRLFLGDSWVREVPTITGRDLHT